MAHTITKIPKPDADQYKNSRKLFLVPLLMTGTATPDEGKNLISQYWQDVRNQVENLEGALGKVAHVYHEGIYDNSEDGLKMIEDMNPLGTFIRTICNTKATLESTDDQTFLAEASDWQRCISIGLMSKKVYELANTSYQNAKTKRYEHIGKRIDDTLGKEGVGILFISQDHGVQFPPDIKVFYVAPPSLDAAKRWMDEQMRTALEKMRETNKQPDSGAPQEES